MERDQGDPKRCGKCGGTVEGDQIRCTQCMIEQAEEALARSEEEGDRRPAAAPQPRRKPLLRLVILAVCLALFALQIPRLFAAFEEAKPLRRGIYETDRTTDRCIANLWRAARLLQDGSLPGDDLLCPASGAPYVVVRDGSDLRVVCPNPDLHGVSRISAGRNNPRPEVKR